MKRIGKMAMGASGRSTHFVYLSASSVSVNRGRGCAKINPFPQQRIKIRGFRSHKKASNACATRARTRPSLNNRAKGALSASLPLLPLFFHPAAPKRSPLFPDSISREFSHGITKSSSSLDSIISSSSLSCLFAGSTRRATSRRA